ncbi:MAG: AAA family ATPase [Wolbachia endosymbiont of Fragariocoptes setiger]|nr:AAA family ATPase [Wolbachia endosymbiont of Fragariocoptes setiger]
MIKIIGHDQAKKKLINNLCIQSWLVCGQKGIGKATLIKNFAYWLLKEREALDLHIVDDNHSIGIEQVREMKNFLYLSPIQSSYKVVIIDSLEAMTENAKNAMLKILEEPPKNSKIFVICHRPWDIQITIKSRCFLLNLFPLTYEETRKIVLFKSQLDDKIFDIAMTFFPGSPGMILNSDMCGLYESFHMLFDNPDVIKKIINSNIELELISHIIQTLLKRTTISFDKWRKIDELFIAAKKLHLDKTHVLTCVMDIVASSYINLPNNL